MNYADIKQYDIANGPGIRVSVFVSGCNHHCKGCFNEAAWNFKYGTPFTEETIEQVIEYLAPDYVGGLSLLGGEPFEKENQKGLLELVKKVREKYPNKTIWCYTGFDFEEDILGWMREQWDTTNEFLSYLDVIVDGKFVEELKDLSIRFRGSNNQRIIKVQDSLAMRKVVLWE